MKTANQLRTIPRTNGNSHRELEGISDVVRQIPPRVETSWDPDRRLSALDLANRTKDVWLIAQSQKLRAPMSSMASMLGLMELAHQLALVRPLHQTPSEFNEAAFKHLRRNFEQLVVFFNELADLTGEGRLKIDQEERPIVKNSTRPIPANTRV